METQDPVVVEKPNQISDRTMGLIVILVMFLIGGGIGYAIRQPDKGMLKAQGTILRNAFEEGAVYGAQAIAQGATNYSQVILSAYRFKAQAKASVATMQQSQIEQARAQYKP